MMRETTQAQSHVQRGDDTSAGAAGPTRRQPDTLERNDRFESAPAGQSQARPTDPVTQFIHDNPTVALAGFAALGAIVALALMPRREPAGSTTRALRRDIAAQARDLRRAVRQEMRDRGLEQRIGAMGSALSSFDWQPYVKPVVEQAITLAEDAKTRLGSALK